MKLIKMIKSGLVNQKRGGGFEQGYPSQKYPKGRDEFIRPYVDNSDPTIIRKSEYSDPMAYKAVTPSPVQYNDIFRKKATPDERLYILKQIQQGLDKVQKGILGKIPGAPTVAVPSAAAPSGTQPSDEIGQTIGGPPAGGGGGGIVVGDAPDDMPDPEVPTSSNGVPIAEYETAVPKVSGEINTQQTDLAQYDGTTPGDQARASDYREAFVVTNPTTVDPVKVPVVNGTNTVTASLPGAFPKDEPQEESKEEPNDEMTEFQKQEAGMLRDKPRSDFYARKSKKERLRLWHQQFDRVQNARASHGNPQMSSTNTPFKVSPMVGRRLSK